MPAQFWNSVLNSPHSTVAGAALATSVTLTDISPGSNGQNTPAPLVLPANFLYAGQVLRMTASGVYSNTSTPTLLLGFYYGGVAGVALGVSAAITTATTVTNMTWKLECTTVIRSVGTATSGGTAVTTGTLVLGTSTTASSTYPIPGSGLTTAAIDTTASKTLTVGAQWGTSSSSNTITCHQFIVEAMN